MPPKISMPVEKASIATESATEAKMSTKRSHYSYGVSYLPTETPVSSNQWRNGKKLPKVLDALGNKKWHAAQDKLRYLLTEEYEDPSGFYVKKKLKKKDQNNGYVLFDKDPEKERKPLKTYQSALDLCITRYLKYATIVRELNEVEQFLAHPQKRPMVRECIEGALTRMLEYKDEMIQLDLREFQFLDEQMAELGLTPADVEPTLPHHFMTSRAEVLNARRALLESILGRTADDYETKKPYVQWMPTEAAVLLLQNAQRAFMARLRMEAMRYRKMDMKSRAQAKQAVNEEDMYMMYRYRFIKWVNWVRQNKRDRAMDKEYISMGMMHDPKKLKETWRDNFDAHVKRNMTVAQENEDSYEYDKVMEEQSLIDNEGPGMAFNFRQNILQWALELRDLTGEFPDLPEEEEGGSLAVFSHKTLREVEDELDEYGVKKPTPKPKKKQKKKKSKAKPDKEYKWLMPESQGMPMLENVEHEYCQKWLWKEETDNLHQTHDRELMREDLRTNIEETLRREVDALMREELKRLNMAIQKERILPPKPAKPKPPGKSKSRRGRKKSKDLTSDYTIGELYEQLIQEEIIVHNPPTYLKDFVGEDHFSSRVVEEQGKELLPSLAMVKRQLMEMIVIPLSSANVHLRAPLVKSVMIAGMRSSGKKTLVQAVCHEAGANLFNLTPANLAGKEKYHGKKGMQLLFHMCFKVGKAMEPSIFWVDNCEKMFLKKKDKTDTSQPHKWAPVFPKAIKKIQPGDRLLFLGTSKYPYLAKGAMFKVFPRIVMVPRPDYNTRYQLWSQYIYAKVGRVYSKNVDISSLTKVTNGFTAEDIIHAVNETLTETRLGRIGKGTLTALEFIIRMSTFTPIYMEEEEKMYEWFLKTPMVKLRLKRKEMELEEMEAAQKGRKGSENKNDNKLKKPKK